MSHYVVYIDPARDVDHQREAVRGFLAAQGGVAGETHVGARKAAEASALALNALFLDASALLDSGRDPVTHPDPGPKRQRAGKMKKAMERYEHIRPRFREARLLGITSHKGIAEYLTETNTPLPSGKVGRWQGVQVKRALEWLGEEE